MGYKVRPLKERRPKEDIEVEYEDARKKLESLHKELAEHSYCECGSEYLTSCRNSEFLEDGWLHKKDECLPPDLDCKRCRCGYALIRADRTHWDCAAYSTGDDPRKHLTHTSTVCFDSLD